MFGSNPFFIILKHPFNYLTGQWLQPILVKNCPGSVSAHQKEEKSPVCPYCGAENGILLFLINKALKLKKLSWQQKILHFSVPLILFNECTKFHIILTSTV